MLNNVEMAVVGVIVWNIFLSLGLLFKKDRFDYETERAVLEAKINKLESLKIVDADLSRIDYNSNSARIQVLNLEKWVESIAQRVDNIDSKLIYTLNCKKKG